MPILRCVETPDRLTEPSYDPAGEPPAALRRVGGSLWGLGEQATWVLGLVLVRIISIPDEFFFAGRGIGLWISLLASVALIGAGLLQASEEL